MNIERKGGKIFCVLKGSYLIETPEEKVRQEYIHQLIDIYGYTIEQMEQEVQVSNAQRGQGKARADIVIWKNTQDKLKRKSAFIVIECKAENVKIHEEDYFQGFNYAAWAGADFFVTTNQKETKFFRVNKGHIPQKLDEIIAIPSAEEANNDRKISEMLNRTKVFTRDEFSRMLFKCHSIIRNNDKLSPEAAFDEISKVLFMKIKYEREQKGTKVFTKDEFVEKEKWFEKEIRPSLKGTPKDLPYMQFLFYNTKEEFREDQLFEDTEIIRIRQNSFESILEELQKYNLSDTADDVKGIAFEEFLGKTFRGELGQFFTPRTLVDFMTHILDPQEGEIICDPTCGSGGFLIKSFEFIREKIEKDIQAVKDKFKIQLMGESYESLTEDEQNTINKKINEVFVILNKELEAISKDDYESRLYNLSHNCIYGTDANPRMARTSKMNMIMHGDGHGGVHHHDGLLNINGIFQDRFDVILTNPPFGARIDKNIKISDADKFTDETLIAKYRLKYGSAYDDALNQVNNNIGKSLLSLFPVGSMSGLTEVLFIERCLDLLKPGGRMGIVLPEGVLNTSNLQKVREHFESRAKIILICSIPQDVFIAAGATVKPSLVFFKKFTEEEAQQYQNCVETAEAQTNDPAEVRALVKKAFDYEIPIAKVDKAGITTTGAACENELTEVEKEFSHYNKNIQLWENRQNAISYVLTEDGRVLRTINGKEQELV